MNENLLDPLEVRTKAVLVNGLHAKQPGNGNIEKILGPVYLLKKYIGAEFVSFSLQHT